MQLTVQSKYCSPTVGLVLGSSVGSTVGISLSMPKNTLYIHKKHRC